MTHANTKGIKVVAVIPHPDDESYAMGGTLALLAKRGAKVRILCLTDGGAGRAVNPPADSSLSLGEVRSQELEASARALGCVEAVVMGLPDGNVPEANGALFSRFCEILSEWAPSVVITLGRDGVYGHRDHLACTRWVDAWWALDGQNRGCSVLHTAFERDLFDPLRARLLRYRPTRRLILDPSARLGCSESAVELVVDIGHVVKAKLAAIGAHQSQLLGQDPESLLGSSILGNLLDFEWFTVAHGPAVQAQAILSVGGVE